MHCTCSMSACSPGEFLSFAFRNKASFRSGEFVWREAVYVWREPMYVWRELALTSDLPVYVLSNSRIVCGRSSWFTTTFFDHCSRCLSVFARISAPECGIIARSVDWPWVVSSYLACMEPDCAMRYTFRMRICSSNSRTTLHSESESFFFASPCTMSSSSHGPSIYTIFGTLPRTFAVFLSRHEPCEKCMCGCMSLSSF